MSSTTHFHWNGDDWGMVYGTVLLTLWESCWSDGNCLYNDYKGYLSENSQRCYGNEILQFTQYADIELTMHVYPQPAKLHRTFSPVRAIWYDCYVKLFSTLVLPDISNIPIYVIFCYFISRHVPNNYTYRSPP